MTAPLSVEWLKVRRYRTFWIILGLFVVLALLGNYVFNNVIVNDDKMGKLLLGSTDFGSVWYNTTYMVSHFVIFLSLLMVLLTGNEFQYRTHRQNVIDGWRREQFLNAKWSVALTMSVGVILFTAVLGIIVGALVGADFSGIGSGVTNLFWIGLLSLNYIGAGLMAALLIRRSGLALIVLLAYYLIVDNLLHSVFKFKFKVHALDFLLPFETADQMMPVPRMSAMVSELAGYEQLPTWQYAIATAVWIGIFYFISRQRTLRSDW